MKTYKITEATLNAVLAYLSEQKFKDANPLVQALFKDANTPGAMEETTAPTLVEESKTAAS